MSFKLRVLIITASCVALASLMSAGASHLFLKDKLVEPIDRDLRNTAKRINYNNLKTHLAPAPYGPPAPESRPTIPRLPEAPLGGARGYLQVIYRNRVYRPKEATQGLPITPQVKRLRKGGRAFYFEAEVAGHHLRIYNRPIKGGVVQIARPLTEINQSLKDLSLILGLISLTSLILALFLSLLATRAILRPLTHLNQRIANRNSTDLSRLPESSDELGSLAKSFNKLMEALENSRHAQEQLVLDASHELRTPLTSLRLNLELLFSNELDRKEQEALKAQVMKSLDELSRLISDVVSLARGEEHLEKEEFYFNQLVGQVITNLASHYPKVSFLIDLEPNKVYGVYDRIERAVRNLIDNAIKWGEEPIEIRLKEGVLEIRDHGPGFKEEERKKVFRRFYRGIRDKPGSGLGLAIAKQVAEAHEGWVEVDNHPEKGAVVRFKLPIS